MNNTRWFAYIGFTDGWSRCTVNVGSDGAVTGGTCSSYEFGVGTETESVTAGSLAITTGCVVTGFIRTNLSGRHTLTHAALDKGKSVLIGVGKDTNGEAWQFSAVKR
jgi:hypothetical protein